MPVAIRKDVAPVKTRQQLDVERTLAQLTLPEKVSLLSGKDNWHTRDIPRLDIPSLRLSDGPNGCRGTKFFEGVPSACFPCATGLASSWDLDLLERVGEAIGNECRAKGVHVLLAPTVNMHRTPLNGRGFESFSEDPLLSGKLAASFIRGCQSTGVAATLKHLVANDQETQRYSISAEVDERALREIYLKPFELAIRESNPWVVMMSYNRLNGKHTSERKDLIQGILRHEWGFEGMTVSDWHGTYSTDEALQAGLDLEMPGPSIIRGAALQRMMTCGKVKEGDIDLRVKQVLGLINRLAPSGIPSQGVERQNPFPATQVLRQSAADAVVLLKNHEDILPIKPSTGRIAVIGPNAGYAHISGGGSAFLRPTYAVTLLDGIRAAAGSAEVTYTAGCDSHKLTPLIGEALRNAQGEPGFDIAFFNEPPGAQAEPIHYLTTTHSNMFFNDNLPGELDKSCYATATATFTPGRSGVYEFGIGALGAADLYLDGSLLIDNSTCPVPGELFFGKGSREETAEVYLKHGVSYDIRAEYTSPSASNGFVGPLALTSRGGLRIGGYHKLSLGDHIQEAVELARAADVAIVVVGLNSEYETEGFDRQDMRLPPASIELIEAVLAVRPDAVICVQSGTPVVMPFANQAKALVHFFYNGNETGNGLADVLFGAVNPSAKLPYTSPNQLSDYASHSTESSYPGVDGKVHYNEGVFVGYRQFSSVGPQPAFAFGHGLSYTSFLYVDCSVTKTPTADAIVVRCTIRNVGRVAGREIVQVYVSPPPNGLRRPTIELRSFAKTRSLEPEEEEVVEICLHREAFAHWDKGWAVSQGEYRVSCGSSSVDIRYEASIELEGST